MDIGFALLAIGVGLVLMFSGYRLARIMIPLWGFLTGLAFGGAIAADLWSTPVLAMTTGIITGLITGMALAVLSYLFYSAAVIVLFGALGYWIGSGFMLLIGSNFGLLAALIGIGLGIVCGVLAVSFNAPKYVLIGITSVAGALAIAGGLLLMTNQVPLSAFGYGVVHVVIENSVLWAFGTLCLAAAGFIMQAISTSHYQLHEWAMNAKPTHHNFPPAAPTVHY